MVLLRETNDMGMKHEIRKLLWKTGFDISRFAPEFHPLARRRQLFESYDIDTVIDVGANAGQFAQELRNDLGYTKRIVSFEPLSAAFELLKAKADKDPHWDAFNFALGDVEERGEINIAANSYSSSMLDMLPSHLRAAPESRYVGKQGTEIRRLDSVFSTLCDPTNRVYLKLDVQGFESRILRGAESSLPSIDSVQMEMSLVPLYEDEILFDGLYDYMSARGYRLVSIEPGFCDEASGELLQIDGIFHRCDDGSTA